MNRISSLTANGIFHLQKIAAGGCADTRHPNSRNLWPTGRFRFLPVVQGDFLHVVEGEFSQIYLSVLSVSQLYPVIKDSYMVGSQATDIYGFQSAYPSVVFQLYPREITYGIGYGETVETSQFSPESFCGGITSFCRRAVTVSSCRCWSESRRFCACREIVLPPNRGKRKTTNHRSLFICFMSRTVLCAFSALKRATVKRFLKAEVAKKILTLWLNQALSSKAVECGVYGRSSDLFLQQAAFPVETSGLEMACAYVMELTAAGLSGIFTRFPFNLRIPIGYIEPIRLQR